MANNISPFESSHFSDMLGTEISGLSYRYSAGMEQLPPRESWLGATGVILYMGDNGLRTAYVNTPGFDQQSDELAQQWLDFHAAAIEPAQKYHDDPSVESLISNCFGLVAKHVFPKVTLVGGVLADNHTGETRLGTFHLTKFRELGAMYTAAVSGETRADQDGEFSDFEWQALRLISGALSPSPAFAREVADHSVVIRMFSRLQLLEDLGRVEEPADAGKVIELPYRQPQEALAATG